MVKTLVIATSAVVLAAVTFVRRWRRRHSGGVVIEGQTISDEWLAKVRGRSDDWW